MKQLLIILGITGILIIGTVGTCGWSAARMFAGILEDKPNFFKQTYPIIRWCGGGLPFVDKLYSMLDNKVYIVLLQNNTELRPSGGFAGSFVKVNFEDGGLKDLRVEDIYQPDGQLPGHVEPPYPIQEAFGQGWWKLRDANWDPDFETAGETVAWFLEQGGIEQVDGIIAINMGMVKKWIEVFGQIKSITFGEVITPENLNDKAQRHAEENWTPGSTQKRDFLGAVGAALIERTKTAEIKEMMGLTKMLWQELKEGQMLVWFRNPELQQAARMRGWTGELRKKGDDYIYIVESNLGANKANCCIERKLTVRGISGNEKVYQGLEMKWKNYNPYEHPKPPESWGGNYINYLRVILGNEVTVEEVQVGGNLLRKAEQKDFEIPNSLRQGRSQDMYVEEEKGDFKILGFWVVAEAGEEIEVKVNYNRKKTIGFGKLQIVRQPGIEGWPLMITQDKKLVFEGWLGEKERIF